MISPDFRDTLLTWLARREVQLRSQLKSPEQDLLSREDFKKGELTALMEVSAFVLTEGSGFLD